MEESKEPTTADNEDVEAHGVVDRPPAQGVRHPSEGGQPGGAGGPKEAEVRRHRTGPERQRGGGDDKQRKVDPIPREKQSDPRQAGADVLGRALRDAESEGGLQADQLA